MKSISLPMAVSVINSHIAKSVKGDKGNLVQLLRDRAILFLLTEGLTLLEIFALKVDSFIPSEISPDFGNFAIAKVSGKPVSPGSGSQIRGVFLSDIKIPDVLAAYLKKSRRILGKNNRECQSFFLSKSGECLNPEIFMVEFAKHFIGTDFSVSLEKLEREGQIIKNKIYANCKSHGYTKNGVKYCFPNGSVTTGFYPLKPKP